MDIPTSWPAVRNWARKNYVPIVITGLWTGSSSSATPTSPASLPQEAVIPTLRPASTRSESMSSQAWRDPSPEPSETENTNKKEDNETVRSAKQKLLRKHKGACKSSWSRIGSLKSFTMTILWNLAKLVKIFPGIIARRHHTDRKRTRLLKERHAVKEGTCAVLLQSNLDEKWWAGSMECYIYLRNIQDLLSDGKTLYERRFGVPC